MPSDRSAVRATKIVLLMLLVLSSTAVARAASPVRWKFTDGETLNYVLNRGIEGKINLSGADITFKLGLTFDVTWKVTGVDKSGTAQVQQTVDRIQVNMSSPLGGNLDYDSQAQQDASGAGPIEPLINGMLGKTFKLKISPLGKVTDIELPETLVEAFKKQHNGGNRDAGFGIGGNAFSERGVKELIEKSVLPLPEGTSGKDVTWKQSFANPLPGIGTQTAETTFSFAGQEKQAGKSLEKIAAKTELTFEQADDPKFDYEITSQEASATFYFDPQAGHLVNSEGTQNSAAELSGPQDLTQEIKETSTMRLGKSPAAKAEASK